MILEDRIVKLYDRIDFCNKYKSITEKHIVENRDNRLKKTEKAEVLELFKKLGYEVKYNTKERFYKIVTNTNNYEFYFHVDIKSGLYELIFGVIDNISKKHLIGGPAGGLFKDISESKGLEEISIRKASFGSYEELASILKESLALYEDFKAAVLELEP